MTCKNFISTIMAAALTLAAFSASPTPARADNDAAKIIFGAAALGIIAAGIAEANDHDHGYVGRHAYGYRYNAPRPRYGRYVNHRRYEHRTYRRGFRNGYRHGYRDGYRGPRYDRPYNGRHY